MIEINKNFVKDQKVFLTYHSTWNCSGQNCAKILSKLSYKKSHYFAIDKYNKEGLCDWYYVLVEGNLFSSLYPETCIENLSDWITNTERFMKSNEENSGTPGNSFEDIQKLQLMIDASKRFMVKKN